jgi:ribonuclease P protein component
MTARSASRGRLSRSADFERVYRHGRSTANRYLVLYCFPNPSVPEPRLGLSVSRKVGGAVERNHVKRLLRDAFAHAVPNLASGYDVVVVARPSSRELAERKGLAGVNAALGELLANAQLHETGAAAAMAPGKDPADGAGRDPADGAGKDPADGAGKDPADGAGRDPADGAGRDPA